MFYISARILSQNKNILSLWKSFYANNFKQKKRIKRSLSVGFIMQYDSYMIDAVLKTLWNRNYSYCIKQEVKMEPSKAFQLIRKMLTCKPSSVWCPRGAFCMSLRIAFYLRVIPMKLTMLWVLKTYSQGVKPLEQRGPASIILYSSSYKFIWFGAYR